MEIQCGPAPCPMPNTCCRFKADAGAKDAGAWDYTCGGMISVCPAGQDQLCLTDDDCQASPTATSCVQGVCVDPNAVGGSDAGSAPEGGGKDAGGQGGKDAGGGKGGKDSGGGG